jgi:transposase
MDVVYPRCCGLDIHSRKIVACVIVPGAEGAPTKTLRTFGTMTADLLALADWLKEAGCTHVAMESTGVYWKPIYNLLEDRFTLLLANARHLKTVPGRKTDVKDCQWIADLLRHGLLRASFVPERPQRELRELTRYRTALLGERSAEVNRVQKTLEGANIKLGMVASDILGKSGRQMLDALVAGTTDATVLADLAQGQLRAKTAQLQQALTGRMGAHQRFLLRQQLTHLDDLDALLEQVTAEIAERLRPFDEAVARLDTIPGVGRRTAEVLVAELGTDMSRFPSAAHAASWAALCPGQHESAGKRGSGRTRSGNRYLRAALTEAAHAAGRTKDTYLAGQYQRLTQRRGRKRAALAVAHSILLRAYYLLLRGTAYEEPGGRDGADQDRQAQTQRLVRRLERLGHTVLLQPAAPAA